MDTVLIAAGLDTLFGYLFQPEMHTWDSEDWFNHFDANDKIIGITGSPKSQSNCYNVTINQVAIDNVWHSNRKEALEYAIKNIFKKQLELDELLALRKAEELLYKKKFEARKQGIYPFVFQDNFTLDATTCLVTETFDYEKNYVANNRLTSLHKDNKGIFYILQQNFRTASCAAFEIDSKLVKIWTTRINCKNNK